jgi:hypothetical protein
MVNGGGIIDFSFHESLTPRENGFVFQVRQLHQNVFSLDAVLH